MACLGLNLAMMNVERSHVMRWDKEEIIDIEGEFRIKLRHGYLDMMLR